MTANQKKGCLSLAAGVIIALISLTFRSGEIGNDFQNRLERNEYGEGEKDVVIIAEIGQMADEIKYSLKERMPTQEEVEALLPVFLEQLQKDVLGENEDEDYVYKPLCFIEEMQGYPFTVSWRWEPREYIDSGGNIKEEIKEEQCVMLTAEIEYEDFMYVHTFPIVLVPQHLTADALWKKMLEEAVQKADWESLHEKYITLPQTVDGQVVKWKIQKENKGIKVVVICIFISVIFFLADGLEAKEKDKKKLQLIKKDYPEFVLKCSMLIGTGMTLRQVFEHMAKNYLTDDKGKKPLYDELLVGIRELENGVPEREVYERFGRRCKIGQMHKFGNMMSRNLRKGSDGLKSALREEAEEAMELHREQIKKQGETAGTKLLFPMLIFLLIVMVIIMIPAFGTFNI